MEESKNNISLNAKDIIDKKVLIIGEVGSGKTILTAQLIKDLMNTVDLNVLTVIDMAPEMIEMVGGKLTNYVNIPNKVRYLSPQKIYAPRYIGKSKKEVLGYANKNKEKIEPILEIYIRKPSKILIINDLTLYLHRGDLKKVLDCIELSNCFLASAYYGSFFTDDRRTGINKREKILINKLMSFMNKVVKL